MDSVAYTAALQYKSILNNIPVAYFLFDHEYNAVDCNLAAVRLFAPAVGEEKIHTLPCDKDCDNCAQAKNIVECPGRTYLINNALAIYPGYEDDKPYTEQVVATACSRASAEGRLQFEHTFSTLYGDIVPCEVTIVPLKLNEKQRYIYYFRDLYDSQRIRDEMKSREAAEEESRAKTRFLARMSHEIRTPMNAVLGITEIELHRDDLPAETKDALLRIYSSAGLLLTIINDVLDLSKVEAGKMEIIAKPYEIAGLIIDTVQLNLFYSGDKHINFNLRISPHVPVKLIGDESRIKQILNNLLSNAFKYTPRGSVSLEVNTEQSDGDGLVLVFKVQDTGQGMKPEQIEMLFDEFSRLNIRSNRNIQGSGLGMSITHQLVNLMDGEIQVESEPGEGTTFTVRIPQQAADGEVIGEELAESLQSMEVTPDRGKEQIIYEPLPHGKVLIVDDVESNLYVIKRLLEPYRLEIDVVASGYEALGKLKYGEIYDIIFMDYMMPDMDGVETLTQIREMGYDYPVIALTANIMGMSPEMFEKNGFNGFISKPINIRTLDTYVKKFIGEKSSKHEAETPKNTTPTAVFVNRLESAVAQDVRLALKTLDISYDAFGDDDIQAYVASTHAMKSALNNVGETALFQIATLLEEAALSGRMSDIRAFSPGFVSRLKELLDSLTRRDENYATDNEDTAFLKSQMSALRLSCENFNATASWKIMDEMEQKPWTKETKIRLNKITEFLIGGYFDEAAELAQDIIDTEMVKQ